MSRLLDQPRGWQKGSREKFFIEPFVKSISRCVRNGRDFQVLYQNTADSKNRNTSQRYSSGSNLHTHNSTGINDDVKNLIPLPDWPVALSRWGLCWDFHIYGFSGLYLFLTIVSAVIFLRFRLRVHRFKIVFNTLILLATSGVFRSVFMLVDPYGYKGSMAGFMVGIMMQAVYPLFCACYGLTQVMLLRIMKVDVGHSRLRTLSCLLGCTLSYLFLVVVIETLVFYERSLKLLLLLDSGCFIVWSLSLGITFICSGFRLTQQNTENKGAREELNASSNCQNSVSNTTGFSFISSSANDASINVFSVDLSSPMPDPTTLTMAGAFTPGEFISDAAMTSLSATFPTSPSSYQTTDHHSDSSARLSRSRPKISSHDHMIIAVATDDDDKSTSSTDVDRPYAENITKRKRTRKRAKQRHALIKNQSKSKSPTSPTNYSAVSVTDENSFSKKPSPGSRIRCKSSHNDQEQVFEVTSNYASLSDNKIQDSQHKTSTKELESPASHTPCGDPPHDTTYVTSSELPLLASSYLQPHKNKNSFINNDDESLDENCNKDGDSDSCKSRTNFTACSNREPSNFVCEENQPPAPCSGTEIFINSKRSKSNESLPEILSPVESTSFSIPEDNDQAKENGYLADIENVISRHSGLSSSRRQSSSRPDADPDHVNCDVTSQKSSSVSSDYSAGSPELSNRRRSNISVSVGPLTVKENKIVQRAIYLTYILTFLFMFACLLQLYTLFGVYGVLGTIPRPDPWPWLIFQSIFRVTEVCIGLTIATIAFIALNYRHKRAKRRQLQHQQLQHQQHEQQQQNLEATGDCIV